MLQAVQEYVAWALSGPGPCFSHWAGLAFVFWFVARTVTVCIEHQKGETGELDGDAEAGIFWCSVFWPLFLVIGSIVCTFLGLRFLSDKLGALCAREKMTVNK